MITRKIQYIYALMFNLVVAVCVVPTSVVFADDSGATAANQELFNKVAKEIKEVLDVWITIGAVTMILIVLGGAATIIMSGGNPRSREKGKALVLNGLITIPLLLSAYVIIRLVLGLFGMAL